MKTTCVTCGSEKSRRGDGRLYCKECNRKRTNAYRKNNPEKAKAAHRVDMAVYTYGIPRELAIELCSREVCDSCGCPDPNGRTLHIDHDHATGKVRGVLCHGCNVSLGSLREDPVRIMKLLDYIKKAQ